MPLATYSDLQSSIADWIARSNLTSVIPDFVTLFEAKINRVLQVRQMITSVSLEPTSGAVDLPDDYLEWKRVTWLGSAYRNLQYVTPAYFAERFPTSPSSTPEIFTIEGGSLKVMPTDDTDVSLLYAQKVPVLSVSNATNWLLTENPDVYLAGSLVEANAYMKKGDDAAAWASKMGEGINEMIRLNSLTTGQSVQRTVEATP